VFVSDIFNGLFVLRPTAMPRGYGSATAGKGEREPTIRTRGAAWVGNDRFTWYVEGISPTAAAALLIGFLPIDVDINGLRLLVDVFTVPGVVIPALQGSPTQRVVPFPIPLQPALAGLSLFGQALVADTGSTLGWLSSAGLEVRVFRL
jgi:hypothetical protein